MKQSNTKVQLEQDLLDDDWSDLLDDIKNPDDNQVCDEDEKIKKYDTNIIKSIKKVKEENDKEFMSALNGSIKDTIKSILKKPSENFL